MSISEEFSVLPLGTALQKNNPTLVCSHLVCSPKITVPVYTLPWYREASFPPFSSQDRECRRLVHTFDVCSICAYISELTILVHV